MKLTHLYFSVFLRATCKFPLFHKCVLLHLSYFKKQIFQRVPLYMAGHVAFLVTVTIEGILLLVLLCYKYCTWNFKHCWACIFWEWHFISISYLWNYLIFSLLLCWIYCMVTVRWGWEVNRPNLSYFKGLWWISLPFSLPSYVILHHAFQDLNS